MCCERCRHCGGPGRCGRLGLGDRLRAQAYRPGNRVSHTVLLQDPFAEGSRPAQMSDGPGCLSSRCRPTSHW
jgi:hypothetical protein